MQEILAKIIAKYSSTEAETIQKAYAFAENAHTNQKRDSGENYITHPLAVAQILADFNMDYETVSAGLLHDVLEDTKVTIENLEKEFGLNISFLVQSVTKLHRVSYSGEKNYIENFHKMILATAKDIRVVIIKLADRLHNLETLDTFKGNKERIAREALEVYAPLASRLGMGEVKGIMEDYAFPYVYPEDYKKLLDFVKDQIIENKKYTEKIKPIVEKILQENNIRYVRLSARAKHLYSLWRKLQKYDFNLERMYDLVALRVIVPDIVSCYETLGVLHKYWQPLPNRIKDYIALPKPNGYQSLHTTVFCEEGKITEFQIRTEEMNKNADYGIAAHWSYKESKNPIAKKYSWLHQLSEWQNQDLNSEDFWENAKIDFFKDRIFVYTPLGDVIELPEEATPLDFAYAIHSDLGDKCIQAKVNGKIMAITHQLNDGDIVEIVTGKNQKPSQDWLKFIKTSKARTKIKERLRLVG
ncbi:MAG: RelA/SpoT family protein [bacterium]|nr:RelA/SpoT family protein [bacterium]